MILAALCFACCARQIACTNVTGSGLSSDFRIWLRQSAFASFDFARDDLVGGSQGGRSSADQEVVRRPVIFVHGNSDRAAGGNYGGWLHSIDYFRSQGYTDAELYATTWGPADASLASEQYHSKVYLSQTRSFLEAVLAYTGAPQIDIISHSMGVTLARKAVLGGGASDLLAGGAYDLGGPLTSSVHTFVAISGANLGLVTCFATGPSSPTCGATNGFYPGVSEFGAVVGRSAFLEDLRRHAGSFEGDRRYSMWSSVDEVVGFGCVVYGRITSRLPGQTGEVIFDSVPYGHFGMKAETCKEQFDLLAGEVDATV